MMKKLLLGVVMSCCWSLCAQNDSVKMDSIFTSKNELIQAKVAKVTESSIHFNYHGETLINELDIQGIEKIVFANGRIQYFKTTETPVIDTSSFVEVEEVPLLDTMPLFEKNTLSILPFHYVKDGSYDGEASEVATDHAYEFLVSGLGADELIIQETIVTAKKMDEHGIDVDQFHSADIGTLREALKTEYILKIGIEECMSPQSLHNDKETGVVVHLKLFDAENEIEIYEASVSENLSIKTTLDTSLVAEREWKPSLEYLLQHFLSFKGS